MKELFSTDKKILYHLDLNAKQSLRALGKKVGLSKSVVQYRMKRLEERGIIKNYYTFIDFNKLGYTNISIQIIYQYYTPEKEQEIINYFINNNKTWFVANVQGKYDLIVMFTVQDMNQFFSFWKQTLKKFRYHFEKAEIAFFTRTIHLPKSYLIEADQQKKEQNLLKISHANKNIIQDIDFKILKEISLNPRKPLTNIAEKYEISSVTIANRIRNLEKKEIIKGYKINIDYTKLGMQLFNVQYNLKNYDNIKKIIQYAIQNSNLISISEVIGNCDLSLNYHMPNYLLIHPVINNLLKTFPDDIKNRITTSYPTIYKSNRITELKN